MSHLFRYHARIVVIASVSALGLVACSSENKQGAGAATPVTPPSATQPPPPAAAAAAPKLAPPAVNADKPMDYPGVHNVVAYTDGLYSGSLPEGDAGFDSLQQMGIKTVISVDGALPEVEAATSRGMRYVHLPIGYNGMSEARSLELARAVKDLPGPVFIHCHHGKHRSAGATGAAAVRLNLATREQMLERMRVSGTAKNYVGLFACVQNASPASELQLLAASNEFPSHWKTSGLVQTMVDVDEAFEHLKLIEKAGWAAPKDHPDLVPAAEAGMLADHFRTLIDDADVKSKPAEFSTWLKRDYDTVSGLEEALIAFKPGEATAATAKADLSARFKKVADSCKECHVKYRD